MGLQWIYAFRSMPVSPFEIPIHGTFQGDQFPPPQTSIFAFPDIYFLGIKDLWTGNQ